MLVSNANGVMFEAFEIFKSYDWLRACFSTRVGGVSTGFLESMNLSYMQDTWENVHENFKRLCQASDISYDGVTYSAQVHGINIKEITAENIGNGLHTPKQFTDVDGIITNKPGIALTTFHADCASIYIADPINKAIGLAHAGWRGTVDNIAGAIVNKMIERYGTKPENILAAIGPSICFSCFETDSPVAEEFTLKLPFSSAYVVKKKSVEEKYLIDLKNINKRLLTDSGVRSDNIEISPHCTKCESELFFSHRRSGKDRGSMVAMMEIIN